VICFGRSGGAIADALAGLPIHRAGGLAAAVTLARGLARSGDAVVLSPACASFDEFRSFEHRGDVFRALVREAS
jgi:UDP-N-acetylmuramoylalanine--D-glutamate ligase